ncbi:uncharacterized protein LOC144954221 [Lampetra fluviatilis]
MSFGSSAHRGVRGAVVDATTGVALQETELLLPWGAVRTDGAEFRVYLPVGTHAIGVRAPGYTERVLTVTVRQADLTASVVLVSLEPDGAPRHSLPRPTGASLLAVAVVAAVVAVVVAVVAVVAVMAGRRWGHRWAGRRHRGFQRLTQSTGSEDDDGDDEEEVEEVEEVEMVDRASDPRV